MIGRILLGIGLCVLMVLLVLVSGCLGGGEVKVREYIFMGLEKLNANDELNIVNLTVQGLNLEPRLNTFNFALKNGYGEVIWSGNAVNYTEIPDSTGVYYIDVDQNNKIDVGDTFCVKAPEDGFFILNWTEDGINPGQFESDF
ncbi:MAG: hypothetical protein KKC68_03120 [Candidatus Thermoplasmatota archaeon]|nr:hypothetical protein [Candidatus Thermoplasmatota archaeon]